MVTLVLLFQLLAGALPNSTLTPGKVLQVTKEQVCKAGYAHSVRNVTDGTKRIVYKRYGITIHKAGEYEIDHLISLELGGSNDIDNLWPQSYLTQPYNAHVKDQLENFLHYLVCKDELVLSEAQKEISTNWIDSYVKRIGSLKSASRK